MTAYFYILFLMVSSVLFYTSKTEKTRVVAIHRPILITQERKTPAYYAYQQAKAVINKNQKIELNLKPTTFLSNLAESKITAHFQVAEMKINKRELASVYLNKNLYAGSNVLSNSTETSSSAYESVLAPITTAKNYNEPINQPEASVLVKKWATIKGKFELIEGVGITDHYIELKRIEEGQVRELGRIDLNAGQYSIDIESPQGYLIAEIKDKNGLLIGRDQERIANLQSRGNYFEGPFIKVGQPQTLAANIAEYSAAAGSFVNSASSVASLSKTQKQVSSKSTDSLSVSLFNNQNTLPLPTDEFINVSEYSSTISRIIDSSNLYENIISVRHVGDLNQTPLFTKKWLSGVVEFISDHKKIEFKNKNGPILMGRVLVDGKSVSGAQVVIESYAGLEPIYFDQFMIPSVTQKSTSANGYFMFLGLEPEAYQVIALKQNAIIGAELFVAENETLAYQNILGRSTPLIKKIKTFDAFLATPVEASIVSTETEITIETNQGAATFKSYLEAGVSEFITSTNDAKYAQVNYVNNAKQDYVHIPMIQKNWLQQIKKFKNISDTDQTGVIIGFTTDFNYDAYLAEENFNKNNLVYFNSYGQITEQPIAGGGFIIYNIPVGPHEVVLQEKTTSRTHSQVMSVKNQQVTITHFKSN